MTTLVADPTADQEPTLAELVAKSFTSGLSVLPRVDDLHDLGVVLTYGQVMELHDDLVL